MSIPNWAQSGPILIIFLFFVVFFRAQSTYWIARGVATGIIKGQTQSGFIGAVARWFNGPIPYKGAAILEKWGIVIIPLCFLTVGLQTAVLAGSGLVRMKWLRFTLAMIPGAIAWALLYGLGMLAIWATVGTAIAGSPWAWVGLLAIFCGGYASTRWKKAQSKKFLEPQTNPEVVDSLATVQEET